MNLDEIPLMGILKNRMTYISQREKLIAQNVANTDTPGYAPHDLKPFTVQGASGSGLAMSQPSGSGGGGAPSGFAMSQPISTNPAHLQGTVSSTGPWKAIKTSDTETTLDGNKVTLEDEMAKMTTSRLDYEAAVGFYQKALGMLALAARKPGG